MSVQLAHKDVPHHAIHDIESFYYVLLFVTMMFIGPRKEIGYKDRCHMMEWFPSNEHEIKLYVNLKKE